MKRYETSFGDDPGLNRTQLNLQESISFLKNVELLDGRLITVNVPNAKTVVVPHGLGRKFKGYFPVKIRKLDGTVRTFDHMEEAQSADESLYFSLTILGSDELTVSFWIF